MKKFMITFHRLVLVGSMMFLLACQRSPQFRQESENGRSDSVVTFRGEPSGQPKKRGVVLNFWNDTPIKQDGLGAFAADELRRQLIQTQRLILPENLRSDLKTDDLLDGNQVKVAQLVREGRKLGVAILVMGRVTRIVFRQKGEEVGLFRQKQSTATVELEVKIFDIQAGREISAITKTGESTSSVMVAIESENINSASYRAELTQYAVREAIGSMISETIKVVDKLTWQGRIARILGPRVYLNAGQVSGLVGGDILRVLNPGEDIYDPETGAYLGRSTGSLKGTLEVVDFIGPDGAVSEVHSGTGFSEGDLVQLY